MAFNIQFLEAAVQGIKAHLQSTFPEEGCGFLLGSDDEIRQVTHFLAAENVSADNRNRRFSIRPEDYLEAERFAVENGLDLLGIYHSHPNHPAVPSGTDLQNAVPWFSYLIVTTTVDGPSTTRSWQLDENGEFQEETILQLAISS